MKLTIKKQKDSPLLRRKEIEAELVFTGPTPSKDAVKNDIAGQMKVKADVVEIKEIRTVFGQQASKAVIYVYTDAASKKEMVELNKKHVEKLKKIEDAKNSAGAKE